MADITTPYSTIKPYLGDLPYWIPGEHQERVASYFKYDDIYWNVESSFKLALADEENGPLYVPKARTIVDTTSHYLLKGLQIVAPEGSGDLKKALDALFKRERFYSRFHTAKHAGVARGDFLLHITADAEKPEGKRISIVSVHPASYFPVYDDWDPDKLLKVHLAEQFERMENGRPKTYIRRLTYSYVQVNGTRRVEREEGMFEEKDWFDPKKEKLVRRLLKRELLPEAINTIPVYHFKNIDWDGEDFGKSEIAGFERLLQGINQSITDEEVALALEGLGVYATDAAGPVDETGAEIPWEISPAKVMQVPLGSYFKRVEGVGSITPMLEHIRYLDEALYEGSGTTDVARGAVDAQVAQSGIALAIKFMPTLAKITERDNAGIETLQQMFFDWKAWHLEYEGQDFGDAEIEAKIGAKLPDNRTETLNELNNMFDRRVISAAYYRSKMEELGYKFPDNIQDEINQEQQQKFIEAQKLAEARALAMPGNGETPGAGSSGVAGRPPAGQERQGENNSNNRGRPNESAGSEA